MPENNYKEIQEGFARKGNGSTLTMVQAVFYKQRNTTDYLAVEVRAVS